MGARLAAGFDCIAFVALADRTDASQCAAELRVALQLPLLVLDNLEPLLQPVQADAVGSANRRANFGARPATHAGGSTRLGRRFTGAGD